MKCGKKIDDDSTFCPYCGNRAKIATATGEIPISNSGANILSVKPTNKKIIFGSVIGLTIVLVIIGAIKLISGLGKTLPEKIFDMSWEEISELSGSDFKEMLDEEGVLYRFAQEDNSWWFETEIADSFLDADCIYAHASAEIDNDIGFEPRFSAHFSVFELAFESRDTFKDTQKLLDESLKKQIISNATVFKDDTEGGTVYLYPVEVSDKYVDKFSDFVENDDFDLDDCSIYKFVQVIYAKSDDIQYFDLDYFPDSESYIDYMCEILVFYTPMTEEEFIALAADYDYDAISGKDIDFDELCENMEYDSLIERISDSEYDLRSVYFVENHGMDIYGNMDVNTDELKKIWYIRNYGFDVETNEKIDTGEWGSRNVYIAYTFNYDVENGTYFESDLDRAKYLIDNNRNPETGEPFEDSTDARFWSMKSLGYDTESGEQVDASLADALEAYQQYLENFEIQTTYLRAVLIYIDADNIPEMIVWDDMYAHALMPASSYIHILKYTSSELLDFCIEVPYSSIYYIPKDNDIYIRTWYEDQYDRYYVENLDRYSLDSNLNLVENMYYSMTYDSYGNMTGVDASSGLSADFTVSDYIKSRQDLMSIDDKFIEIRGYDDNVLKANIFDLYDMASTEIYEAYWFQFDTFELENDILTVKVNDGTWADWGPYETFEFSYPIGETCEWHDGYIYYYYKWGDVQASSFETMKQIIDTNMKEWNDFKDTAYAKEYDIGIESPQCIYIYVRNGVIVDVYMHMP